MSKRLKDLEMGRYKFKEYKDSTGTIYDKMTDDTRKLKQRLRRIKELISDNTNTNGGLDTLIVEHIYALACGKRVT